MANGRRTIILCLLAVLLAAGAVVVGISDNPPGIALMLLSTGAFILAFVHSWRTPRQFLRLVYISPLAFVVSVILHNLIETSASGMEGTVHSLLGGISATFFIFAVLLCPAAFVVGVAGAAVMRLKKV